MFPDNHASKFSAEWWNEHRKRDYFIDAAGCVQLRGNSETALKLEVVLVAKAREIADEHRAAAREAFEQMPHQGAA